MLYDSLGPTIKMAYIDPGTGSMFFTVLIGLISTGIYALRGLILRIKSFSKKENIVGDRIKYLIYSDSKRYWNLFKPICDEFESRNIELTYYTQSNDDPALNEKYKYIKTEFIDEGNKGFTKMNFVKADIVISTTPSLDVYQWKRSKDVKYYVHIPHFCGDLTLYRMFGLDYYDVILPTGDVFINSLRKLEEKWNFKKKEIISMGLPYFDEMKKRYDNTSRIHNDTPVVLLAPSWGPSSILNRFGEKIIDEILKTGYKIVVRPHPQSYVSEKEMLDKLINKYKDVEWNRDNDNFDILNKSDILISDFSGVIFDYTFIFDKPIIYANTDFDKSVYDAYWLDDPIWMLESLPLLGQELNEHNISNVKEIINSCLNEDKYKDGREKTRKEAWCNIGYSSKAIVDYIINKEKEIDIQ